MADIKKPITIAGINSTNWITLKKIYKKQKPKIYIINKVSSLINEFLSTEIKRLERAKDVEQSNTNG